MWEGISLFALWATGITGVSALSTIFWRDLEDKRLIGTGVYRVKRYSPGYGRFTGLFLRGQLQDLEEEGISVQSTKLEYNRESLQKLEGLYRNSSRWRDICHYFWRHSSTTKPRRRWWNGLTPHQLGMTFSKFRGLSVLCSPGQRICYYSKLKGGYLGLEPKKGGRMILSVSYSGVKFHLWCTKTSEVLLRLLTKLIELVPVVSWHKCMIVCIIIIFSWVLPFSQ